jgi:hypothetical protein
MLMTTLPVKTGAPTITINLLFAIIPRSKWTTTKEKSPFRVVILGGSVAGFSLANIA